MHVNLPQKRPVLLLGQLNDLALHAFIGLHRRVCIVRMLQELFFEAFGYDLLDPRAVVLDRRLFLHVRRWTGLFNCSRHCVSIAFVPL